MKAHYLACYRVLEIEPGCTWQHVLDKYRLLVKEWHPDHFGDLHKKRIAEERIKDINHAFYSLSSFFKKNGSLPVSLEPLTRTSVTNTGGISTDDPRRPMAHLLRSIRSRIIFAVILFGVGGIIFLLPNFGRQASHALLSNYLSIAVKNKEASSAAKIQATKEEYFTIGSTLGEVHAVQGAPSKVEDGIWYYGDSKVYFKNGMVQHWQSGSDQSLKARFSIASKNSTAQFSLGSSPTNVLALQGKPTHANNGVWDYGTSHVYFKDGRVSGWDESPTNPLKTPH